MTATDKRPDFVRTAHDVDDAIVIAAPEMFRDLDGRPVPRTEGPAPQPPAA